MIEEKIEFPFQDDPIFRKLAEIMSYDNLTSEEKEEYDASERRYHLEGYRCEYIRAKNLENGKIDGRFMETLSIAEKLSTQAITVSTFKRIIGDDANHIKYIVENGISFDKLAFKCGPIYPGMNPTVSRIMDMAQNKSEYEKLDEADKRIHDWVAKEFRAQYSEEYATARYNYDEGVKMGKEEARAALLNRCQELNVPEEIIKNVF